MSNNGTVRTGLVGQLNIRITEPDISHTTPLIASFCVDRDIFLGEINLPFEAKSLSTGFADDPRVLNPENAGEIAWLYNHIGSTWST